MNEGNIIKMLEMLGSPRHKIKRSSNNIIACCPLGGHADKNPSFTIRINSNGPSSWQCFSCGEKANKTISMLYKIKENGGSWREDIHNLINEDERESAVYQVSRLKDWQNQRKYNNDQVAGRKPYGESGYFVQGYEAKFNEADYKTIMSEVPRYILDRGITLRTCAKWKLGYHKYEYPPRLFIPIFAHDGRMVGWSGRLIYKEDADKGYPKYKHVQHFLKDKYLYGENFIDKSQKTCFIMESFIDVINLDQMGIKNCLAIMGTNISAAQVEKIRSWFEKVVILPHDDKPMKNGIRPGFKMADDCKYALEQAGLKVIIAPIVPQKRQFGEVIRNPQDPGEWNLADVKWVFDMVRRIAHESVSARQEKEKEGRQKETTDGHVSEASFDS